MKLALALFGADLIARRQERGRATGPSSGRCCSVAAAAGCGLIVLQPDMGTALVLVIVVDDGSLFASGVPLRPI